MDDNKNLTVIDSWQVPTKEERETILNYDEEQDSWHIYTDVPKHARKYEKFIDESTPHRKGYSGKNSTLTMVDGYITGANVIIAKKPKSNMTEEQKQQAGERLRKGREKQQG